METDQLFDLILSECRKGLPAGGTDADIGYDAVRVVAGTLRHRHPADVLGAAAVRVWNHVNDLKHKANRRSAAHR